MWAVGGAPVGRWWVGGGAECRRSEWRSGVRRLAATEPGDQRRVSSRVSAQWECGGC